MAKLADALFNLREEVASTIMQIHPDRIIDERARFLLYSDTQRDSKSFTDFVGRPRIFDIGVPTRDRRWQIGKSTSSSVYKIPVTLGYPKTSEWTNAARADINKIRDVFIDTSGSHGVAGIANRHFDEEEQQEQITRSDDDLWIRYTLSLLVWAEVERP